MRDPAAAPLKISYTGYGFGPVSNVNCMCYRSELKKKTRTKQNKTKTKKRQKQKQKQNKKKTKQNRKGKGREEGTKIYWCRTYVHEHRFQENALNKDSALFHIKFEP